ncbi:MAG: glucose-1-phosphate cytidylyltransferase, partial [Caulobacterales bacterium]
MKVVIFAGGYGTRLSEETSIRPKPMVDIGPKPILWHIMKMYSHYGHNDFVILGGYRVDYIRRYFLEYAKLESDYTINLRSGELKLLREPKEDWNVTVLDTGLETMTGGRLQRARKFIGDERFLLTYGDGVSDVDINDLIRFHVASGAAATVTAVAPPGRFGVLGLTAGSDLVQSFREKDQADVGLINAGFFVCEPRVFDVIDGDSTVFEQEPMDRLVQMNELAAYRHMGFWQS